MACQGHLYATVRSSFESDQVFMRAWWSTLVGIFLTYWVVTTGEWEYCEFIMYYFSRAVVKVTITGWPNANQS